MCSLSWWHQNRVLSEYKACPRPHSFQNISSTIEMWEAEIKDKKAMETFQDSLWIWVCRNCALGRSHKESGQCIDSGNAAMYPWGGFFQCLWSWPFVYHLGCWCHSSHYSKFFYFIWTFFTIHCSDFLAWKAYNISWIQRKWCLKFWFLVMFTLGLGIRVHQGPSFFVTYSMGFAVAL